MESKKILTFAAQIKRVRKLSKNMTKRFAEHSGLNLTQVNNEILQMWKEKNVFWRSVDEREGCPQFVFYEGPPSANGHPRIHHVRRRSIKDTCNR